MFVVAVVDNDFVIIGDDVEILNGYVDFILGLSPNGVWCWMRWAHPIQLDPSDPDDHGNFVPCVHVRCMGTVSKETMER